MNALSLLLWNVAMTPAEPKTWSWKYGEFFASITRQSGERAQKIAQVLNNYDIVILNESFIYRDKLLSYCKHKWVYTEPRPWYKFFNSGVVILSRIQLDDFDFIHYDNSSTWDSFTAKGLLSVTLSFERKTIRLYGTHMQAGNEKAQQIARLRQAMQIKSTVEHTNDKYNIKNYILAGDFNCGPTEDKTYEHFSPHYVDKADAIQRNGQFRIFADDMNRALLFQGEDDICGILYRFEDDISIRRMEVQDTHLSDTGSLAVELTWNVQK